jgi:hypothetical protein
MMCGSVIVFYPALNRCRYSISARSRPNFSFFAAAVKNNGLSEKITTDKKRNFDEGAILHGFLAVHLNRDMNISRAVLSIIKFFLKID